MSSFSLIAVAIRCFVGFRLLCELIKVPCTLCRMRQHEELCQHLPNRDRCEACVTWCPRTAKDKRINRKDYRTGSTRSPLDAVDHLSVCTNGFYLIEVACAKSPIRVSFLHIGLSFLLPTSSTRYICWYTLQRPTGLAGTRSTDWPDSGTVVGR